MRTMENPVHIAAYKGFGIITTPMAFPKCSLLCNKAPWTARRTRCP